MNMDYGDILLRLAAAVHPTAAVGGTPRGAAVALIAELEGMDRGRRVAPLRPWLRRSDRRRAGPARRRRRLWISRYSVDDTRVHPV